MHISRYKFLLIIGLGIGIFFVGILLPLFANIPGFHSYYQATKYTATLVCALLGLFLISISTPKLAVSRSIFSKAKYIVIPVILLTLSIIFSQSSVDSLLGQYSIWEVNVITIVSYIIIFFSLSIWVETLKKIELQKEIISILFQLTSIITIAYAIGEYYLWHPQTGYVSEGIQRVSLGFRNPLYAGYFLSLITIFCFVQFFLPAISQKFDKKNIWILAKLALFIGSVHALFLTFTRTAYTATVVSIAIVIIMTLWKMRKQNALIYRGIIAIGISLVIVSMNIFLLQDQLALRNKDIFTDSAQTQTALSNAAGQESVSSFFSEAENYSSWYIRLKEWEWGIKTVLSSPKEFLLGTGPDAAYLVLPEFRDPIFNAFPTDSFTRPYNIRNLYITVILMFGLPFTVILFGTILFGIHRLLKKFSSLSLTEQQLPLFLSLVSILIGFLINGFFYVPIFPIISFIILVIVVLRAFFFSDIFKVSINNKKGIAVLPLLFGILLIAWIVIVSYTEIQLDQISLYWKPTREILTGTTEIPINTSVFKRIQLYYFPEDTKSSQILNELSLSKNLDDLRVASAVWYEKGRDTNNNEYVNRSIAILEGMIERDPSSPVHNDELGLRYLYLKDFTKSQSLFEKAISLKKDYWFAYLHMGELLRQTCKPKEAITWYEKAKSIPQYLQEIDEAKQEIEQPIEGCQKE